MFEIQRWLEMLRAGEAPAVINEMQKTVAEYEEHWALEAAAEEAWARHGAELTRDLCSAPELVEAYPF